MPLYSFKCEGCSLITEELAKVDTTFIYCPRCSTDEHKVKALKTLSTFGTYKIKGNNSASVTPKKYRGGTG